MKDNSIIKFLVTIILGTIAFQLLLNIFTGGGSNMNDMYSRNMMGYGYGNSVNGFLSALLVFLIKFLMIVLVIAILVGFIMWIKNTFFKDANFNFIHVVQTDPILKTTIGIVGGVLGILLVVWLFNNLINPSVGYNMGNMNSGINTMDGYGMMNGYNGFNTSQGFGGLLSLLIQVLYFVLISSLILGVFAFLKKQYDAGAFSISKSATKQDTMSSIITNTNNANMIPIDGKNDQKIDQSKPKS